MDRNAVSAFALVATVFAINQHQLVAHDGAPAAPAAVATTGTTHSEFSEERPAATTAHPASGCGIGAVCDALLPYRDTGPWAASCARFGEPKGATAPARAESVILNSNTSETLGRLKSDWCLPDPPPNLYFLIVMVPDPLTTHLALYFDRTVEAVEAAAQQRSLFLDRYWLPWPVPGGITTAPGDTGQDIRASAILSSYRSAQPGVMIFSAHDPSVCKGAGSADSCVTYAFMVSESPTSGINKTQFENAVAYAGVLSGLPAPPVHVVGPYFSGSVPSAISLVKTVTGAQLDFVSGTMSSLEQADSLRKALQDSKIDFKQTLHDDSRAQDFLLRFLHDRHLTMTGQNVAILQEDETRYGNSAIPPTPSDPKSTSSTYPGVRFIKFPRELSRLRNASPSNFGAAPTASSQYAVAPVDPLSWNWKDAATDDDSVPAFSGQQEPLSQQAILLSIADVIRQQHIEYIGITATDIFDILFLSKFLKIEAPNTRVFVLDSDLLMVKASSEGRELDGTLAVTTYPLIPRNADWTQPDGLQPSVDIFPSRISQGIYNAVLFQLNADDHDGLREYSDPLADPSDQTPNNRPPLWLTMVGRNGFWPVSREPNDALSGKQMAPTPGPVSNLNPTKRQRMSFDPPDGVSLLVQAVLLIWSAIHLIGLLYANKAPYAWFRQFHVRTVAGDSVHAQHQTFYVFCATLTLGAMLLLIALSFMRLCVDGRVAFLSPHRIPVLFTVFYGLIGFVGVLLTMAAIWIANSPIMKKIDLRYRLPSWILYILTIGLWGYLNSSREGDGTFFAQRALSFSNEVSPLIPIEVLLLIYYVWAWTFIRKVRLSESKQVVLPDLDLLGPAGLGLNNYWADLRAATDEIVFNPRISKVLTIGFASAIMLLLRPWETLLSVEGRPYDWLVVLLVVFICLLIVMVLGRYLLIWNRLKRILRGLERTPLRRAFSRFPNTYAWSPLWYEDAERRAYAISARSVECFRALTARGNPCEGELKLRDELTADLEQVVTSDTDDSSDDDRSAAVLSLQTKFGTAAEYILKNGLQERWMRDGGSDTLDEMNKESAEAGTLGAPLQCKLLEEEFVALRFVGLIHYESAQLKNLVALLGIGFVLAVVAVGSYPFLAARQCDWSLAAAFVAFGAAIVVSFAQMDRDAILSRLSGTVAGRLDWSFLLRAVSYGGLPLLTLLASQFPSVGRSLLAWLEPALNELH